MNLHRSLACLQTTQRCLPTIFATCEQEPGAQRLLPSSLSFLSIPRSRRRGRRIRQMATVRSGWHCPCPRCLRPAALLPIARRMPAIVPIHIAATTEAGHGRRGKAPARAPPRRGCRPPRSPAPPFSSWSTHPTVAWKERMRRGEKEEGRSEEDIWGPWGPTIL